MRQIHSYWIALLLIIFIVIVINYHFNVLRQYEKYNEDNTTNNILGPNKDQSQVIPGRLVVLNNLDNAIGKSALPDSSGNISLVPEPNQGVFIGKNARHNQIGESAKQNQVGQSWFPYQDGNTYIRSGRDAGQVIIGDTMAKQVSIGSSGNKTIQLGTDTWFPWRDGNVYIRPDRNSADKLIRIGDFNTRTVELGNPSTQVRVRGRMLLGDFAQGDNTDPYYLEKVNRDFNNSFLKLNLADDADESLQIWANHCGSSGGCGGNGAVQHTFRADGTAIHNGNLCIKNTCINEGDLQKLQRVRA